MLGKNGIVIASLIALLMTGCGKKEPEYKDRPVEDLYNAAYDKLLKRDYDEAGKLFDETERQHPYSEWATRAQLMSAYSYFMAQKYGDAATAIESFIQLHPGHPHIDYALYMKGMIEYEQIPIVQRDQETTKDATKTFVKLIRRFPQSKYTRAAKPKVEMIKDHLAGRELYIARFYMRKEHYIGALGRLQTIMEYYQGTTHTPEALHRMVECYVALGLMKDAERTAAVLGHNYPGSSWYADTYYLLRNRDFRSSKMKEANVPWYKKLLRP